VLWKIFHRLGEDSFFLDRFSGRWSGYDEPESQTDITEVWKFGRLDNLPYRVGKLEPGRIHANPGLLGIKRTMP
jgi:hypothetical protein